MLEYIETTVLRAVFSADKGGVLPPYLGSTLRGLIGHGIREFVCRYADRKCFLCEDRKQCAYAKCFASPGGAAGPVNPFVLHCFTMGKTKWEAGDCCTFDLTLIGDVTKEAGLFVDALCSMGERGWGAQRIPFSLQEIIDPVANRLLWSGGKTWLRNLRAHPFQEYTSTATTVLIRFDTPVCIKHAKNLCTSLNFETLVTSILRRISLLSQAFMHCRPAFDETLGEQAARVKTVRQCWKEAPLLRYSMNQRDNRLELPAIIGWGLYEGDLGPFVPLLQAGQVLHVGKNATHGFGHYMTAYDR